MITIFHNARCSKSREALSIAREFAEARRLPLEIVDYLKSPPSPDQLTTLRAQLGGDIRDMVRSNEPEYASLELAGVDDFRLMQAISSHPILLQRPIVVFRGNAVIGRPPECLHALFEAAEGA